MTDITVYGSLDKIMSLTAMLRQQGHVFTFAYHPKRNSYFEPEKNHNSFAIYSFEDDSYAFMFGLKYAKKD